MGSKRMSIQALLLLVLIIVCGALFIMHFKQRVIIDEYKDVIAKQDSMIKELSFSNELVKEYFDVNEDSLTHQKAYVLKSEKSLRIKEKEYINIEPKLFLDGTEISVDDLVSQFNTNEKEKEEIIKDLINNCNSWIQKYDVLAKEKKIQKDSLQMQKMVLGLINKNYGIDYSGVINDTIISIHLLSNQADSAFVLLKLYRDKMSYNPDINAWIIKR